MNRDLKDTLPIVYSYLNPLDLVHVSNINHFFNQSISQYLLYKLKTTSMEEWICPICSYWIKDKEIIETDSFYDLSETQTEE